MHMARINIRHNIYKIYQVQFFFVITIYMTNSTRFNAGVHRKCRPMASYSIPKHLSMRCPPLDISKRLH